MADPVDAGLTLLPAIYASPERIAVLKMHSIRHEDLPTATFFLACVRQFVNLTPTLSKEDKTRHSLALASMLQRNVEAYRAEARNSMVNTWAAVKIYLADCPIFLTADLPFPYNQGKHEQLVSLKDSEGHANYRLVSNAVAVTSNAVSDTNKLRARLGLPAKPQLAHVVGHLLMIAKGDTQQLFSKSRADPLLALVLEDIENAYACIVNDVNNLLLAANSEDPLYISVNRQLATQAWVLFHDRNFVTPNELGFNLLADTSTSELEQLLVVLSMFTQALIFLNA